MMHDMTSPSRDELILASLAREQDWALSMWHAGYGYRAMRALGIRPVEAGGIGRDYTAATYRGLVEAARVAQGDIVGTREQRVERRQLEYDALAQLAKASMQRAAEIEALDLHAMKMLLDTRAAEAKMHGDDRPVEANVNVTHHDAVNAELDAMLARLDVEAE